MTPSDSISIGHFDVVVVGGRVAGASTAMLLARRGFRVLMLDRAPRPDTDTLSTHALMRGGVLQLARWGLLPRVREADTTPVRRVIFHYPDRSDFVAVEPRDGVDALYAPRRKVLDAILVEAAVEAGVDARFGVSVTGLVRRDGRVTGVNARLPDGGRAIATARWVVGADGLRSKVADEVGASKTWQGEHSGAFIYAYFENTDDIGYEWFYQPGVTAGIIPTNDGQACVWAGASGRRFRAEYQGELAPLYRRLLTEAAAAPRLTGARRTGRIRGFGGVTGFLRQTWGPGWALVGDANGFLDPISAHGMTDALRDAELLAHALDRSLYGGGDAPLLDYAQTRDACTLELARVTDRIAAYDWDVPTVRTLLREMARQMRSDVHAIESLERPTSSAA